MQIDRSLNFVMPVERENGTIYVHSMPISRQVFEANFLPISKTFTRLYTDGIGTTSGPRVAALMLREVATEMGIADKIERELFAEIRRLTNVILPGNTGCRRCRTG